MNLGYDSAYTQMVAENDDFLSTNPLQRGSGIDGTQGLLDTEGDTTGVLQFTRTWTIVQSTGEASTGGGFHLFDAQVIVSWNNNGNQSVTLDSKITD